jgi:hypothetical protein
MSFKKFIVGTDNHGELGCPIAIKKFLDFCDDWKPHYKIHLGDAFDFACLRRGASQEDKADGVSEDFHAGMTFLEAYRPHFLTLGNHDDRIWMNTVKCGDGILRERCQELAAASERRFKQLKIKWIPYEVDEYIKLPDTNCKLVHGFPSSKHPAAAHHQYWGDCIAGHVHKPDEYTARHIDRGQAFTVGCLADIKQMTYANRHPAKLGWRQGWLYGYINTKTGKWNAWNVKNDQGTWLSPMGIL